MYLCCIFVHISDEKPDEKWLLFDAPVDTLWIESMNSVMDDNKVLTLINGERIAMPDQVRTQLIFILLLSCPSSPNLVICLARLLHSGEPSH